MGRRGKPRLPHYQTGYAKNLPSATETRRACRTPAPRKRPRSVMKGARFSTPTRSHIIRPQ